MALLPGGSATATARRRPRPPLHPPPLRRRLRLRRRLLRALLPIHARAVVLGISANPAFATSLITAVAPPASPTHAGCSTPRPAGMPTCGTPSSAPTPTPAPTPGTPSRSTRGCARGRGARPLHVPNRAPGVRGAQAPRLGGGARGRRAVRAGAGWVREQRPDLDVLPGGGGARRGARVRGEG